MMKHTVLKLNRVILPLLLVGLTAAVMLLPDSGQALLSYRRAQIEQYQWWGFLTANLVHANWIHWCFNAGGFLLIWRLFYDSFSNRWWLVLLLGLFISNILLIHFLTPRINNYVGMSGALHGVMCLCFIARNMLPGFVSFIGVLVVIGKVIRENWFQSENPMAELIGRNVAVEAHLYGVITGIIIGIGVRIYQEYLLPSKP